MSTRSTIAIFASSLDYTIGRDNDIPWSCKTDMKFFKKATTGNVVIMGRKTYESMDSRPLPNRVNIVVSRKLDGRDHPGIIVARSTAEAMLHATEVDLSSYKRNTATECIFVIGGVEIYTSLISVCDEVLHSVINVECGQDGYGADFITNHVKPVFRNELMVTRETLYHNDGVVTIPGDVHQLRSITQYYRDRTINMFEFKQENNPCTV